MDDRAPERLRTLPSWLAGQVSTTANRLVGDALAEHGLRRHHYRVLVALAEDGEASQADLGRRLWLDRSDLHGVLAELDAAGLTTRVRDEQRPAPQPRRPDPRRRAGAGHRGGRRAGRPG